MNIKKLVLVLGTAGALVGSTLAFGATSSAFYGLNGNIMTPNTTKAKADSLLDASPNGSSGEESYCNGICSSNSPCLSMSKDDFGSFTSMLEDASISYDFATCNVYIAALGTGSVSLNMDTFNNKGYKATTSILLAKPAYAEKFGVNAMKTTFDTAKTAGATPSSSVTLNIDKK